MLLRDNKRNVSRVAGCLDTGIGHEQLNGWLSCMNIPTISRNTLKRAEDRIGPIVKEVAEESCRKALAEERELTRQFNLAR